MRGPALLLQEKRCPHWSPWLAGAPEALECGEETGLAAGRECGLFRPHPLIPRASLARPPGCLSGRAFATPPTGS